MIKFNISRIKLIIYSVIVILLLVLLLFTIMKVSNNKNVGRDNIPVVLPNEKTDNIPIEVPKDDQDIIEDEKPKEPEMPNIKEEEPVIPPQQDNKATSIPVLAYHNFMTNKDKLVYTPNDKYTISIESFEQQLKYLYDNGYHTIDYISLYKWLNGEIELDNKSFMITIDDGNISAYHLATPLIEKYNFSAIIFVITGRLKEHSNTYDPASTAFFGDDILTDIENNHKNIILGSHSTYLHAAIDGKNPMEVLSYDELLRDLSNSQQRLNTEVFAYPFGMYNDNYLNAAKNAGFLMAFTFKPSNRVRKTNGVYEIPRININSEVSFGRFKYLVETDW